jgi:hypothetical protein
MKKINPLPAQITRWKEQGGYPPFFNIMVTCKLGVFQTVAYKLNRIMENFAVYNIDKRTARGVFVK